MCVRVKRLQDLISVCESQIDAGGVVCRILHAEDVKDLESICDRNSRMNAEHKQANYEMNIDVLSRGPRRDKDLKR